MAISCVVLWRPWRLDFDIYVSCICFNVDICAFWRVIIMREIPAKAGAEVLYKKEHCQRINRRSTLVSPWHQRVALPVNDNLCQYAGESNVGREIVVRKRAQARSWQW